MIYFFLIIIFFNLNVTDRYGENVNLEPDNYYITLSGINCQDCSAELTDSLESYGISEKSVFFLVEINGDSPIYKKKMIKNIKSQTEYYNDILFYDAEKNRKPIYSLYKSEYKKIKSPSLIIGKRLFTYRELFSPKNKLKSLKEYITNNKSD